jgi:hypothetical protein
LLAKLDSNTWNTVRVGVVLSYALATGLALGGNGQMSEALDTKLTLAANSYVFTPEAECGFTEANWRRGNTCLEDHAIAALAHGVVPVDGARLVGRPQRDDHPDPQHTQRVSELHP